MAPRKKPAEPRTANYPVSVDLSMTERIDSGIKLTDALNAAKAMEAKHQAAKKTLKLEADTAQQEIERLTVVVNTGKEERQMPCSEDMDFNKGTVKVTRIDNGAFVTTRKMTDEERQMQIDGIAGGETRGDSPEAQADE